MKSLLSIITIGIFSMTVHAGTGNWLLVSESHYFADDNEAFMLLQSNFPQHFSGIDATAVSSASLDLYTFNYAGPNSCAPNDPRLTFESSSKVICFNTGMNCIASTTSMPAPFDPCM